MAHSPYEALRVWILQNGEELPSDPGPPRLLRQAILAETLAARGHHVTYWASSFNHQQKFQRPSSQDNQVIGAGYRVRFLPARSYSGNVSLDRMRSHREAAASFRRLSANLAPPDVVLSGYPTIELAHAAVTFARNAGIPSMVDFRDQWPDIIEAQIAGAKRQLLRPILRNWHRLRREVVQGATAVCGITDEFVTWALSTGHRPRGPLDRAFPLSPPLPSVDVDEAVAADAYWDELLGLRESASVWTAYPGTLARRTDLMTVVRASSELDEPVRSLLKIVICGSGDLESDIIAASAGNPNLVYAGRRNAAEVRSLLSRCAFGIMPYHRTSDFMMSYPNKLGEFLSYGLPVLTGLGGISGRLLADHNLLLPYAPGDPRSCAQAMSTAVLKPASPGRSEEAKDLYTRRFDPRVVYPTYADHVETVAIAGRSLAGPEPGVQ